MQVVHFYLNQHSLSFHLHFPQKTHPNKDSNAGFSTQLSSAFLLSTAVGGSLQKKNFKETARMGSSKGGKLGQAKLIKADYWINTTPNFHDCLCLYYKDGSFSLWYDYFY